MGVMSLMNAVFLWREVSLNAGVGRMVHSGTVGGRDSVGRTRERESSGREGGKHLRHWMLDAILVSSPPRVVSKAGGHYPLPSMLFASRKKACD